jgi:citrate lyase subunit beta/citryl-CoA lyase
MPINPRPLRSVQFIPGNKERWIDRIPEMEADAYILDLEDSVPDADRPAARQLVRAKIEKYGATHPIFVRVNALDSGHTFDDLDAVVCPGLYGVFLPKVRGPRDLIVVDGGLNWFERRNGVPEGLTIINPLMEMASGLQFAYEIATASPRVAHMGGGTAKGADIARAVGFEWTPEGLETLYLRSRVLLAVRAAGVPYPVSGLWTDLHDLEGLRAFCAQTRRLGYTGMQSIYPGHLPIINEVFSLSEDEIAYWEELIVALEEAERQGTTAINFRGEMVDTAMIKTGRDRLALAGRLARK